MIPCNGSGRRCVCRSSTGFSLLFGTGWRILSALVDGIFFGLTLMADVARHPGVVACAASGRGQGLAQPLAPYDPQPRVGAAIPDEQHDYAGNALCPSLPRGSGRSDSRCPAPTRDERPSGVGASAPAGRRSPPRPASLTQGNLPQPLLSHQGTALPARREKRLSFVDSVHCAGKTVLVMREILPAGRGTSRDKPTSPASRGAEAIPATRERRSRRAYHPQRGKMRADLPPAASGGQGIRHATGTPATTRTGEYGGRRGCRGARPSHPLPPAAKATTPGCRAEAATQRKKEAPSCQKRAHAGPRRRRYSPLAGARAVTSPTSSASRGAEAIPAKRERRSRRAYHPRSGKMRADLPPAASGGQGVRHATGTPATTRTGEYGGRRGCRGARPSHPLPPAAKATTPGCRAEAASQRKKKRKKPPCPAGRPADGAADLVMRRFSILLNKSALGRGWGAWGEGEPLPRRRRPKGGPQGRAR